MFNQIHVFLKQKLVSPPNNAYPYRAYIESRLNYSPIAKKSHLTAGLWYDDTAGLFEAQPQARGELANRGALNRQHFTLNGKTFDMIRHLHCDIFNQDRMLINGVEIRVPLVRSKDAFCLMDASEDGKFNLKIKEATLIVRRVKINPGI